MSAEREKKKELERDLTKKAETIEDLNILVDELRKQLTSLVQAKEEESEIKYLRRNSQFSPLMDSIEKNLDSYRSQIKQIQDELILSKNKEVDLNNQKNQLEVEAGRLEVELTSKDDEIQRLNTWVGSLQSQINLMNDIQVKKNKGISKYKNKVSSLKESLAQKCQEIDEIKYKYNDNIKELLAVKEEYQEQLYTNLEKYYAKTERLQSQINKLTGSDTQEQLMQESNSLSLIHI